VEGKTKSSSRIMENLKIDWNKEIKRGGGKIHTITTAKGRRSNGGKGARQDGGRSAIVFSTRRQGKHQFVRKKRKTKKDWVVEKGGFKRLSPTARVKL